MKLRQPIWVAALLLVSLFWSGCAGASSMPAATNAPANEGAAADTDTTSMGADSAVEVSGEALADQSGDGQMVETRKIIATADVSLVVAETEAAVDQIEDLIGGVGGFVASADLYRTAYGEAELLRGTLTLRVPAEQLEPVLAQLADLAVEVESSSLNREDVTEQYSDVDARLRNLQATEEELRALLAEVREKPEADSEDILAVYRTLTEIRGEIEQLQGRKNVLDNQIALSTIEVTLVPDALNRPVMAEGWRPAVVVRDALRALVSTVQILGSAAIWIGVYLVPLVLLALIPLGILYWAVRWLLRRSRTEAPVSG